MITSHYLKGKKVEQPANAREISIEINYDKDTITEQITINRWRWIGENAKLIMQHYLDGIIGGVGITEGIPHRIDIENKGIKNTLINGYIDTLEDIQFSCNEITSTTKEKKGIDQINDKADGFTFEYLDSLGRITSDKIVWIPYVINSIPNTREIIITTLTIFVVTQELKREIDYYTSKLPHTTNPFAVTVLVEIAVHVVYTIALILTLVKMIKDLINYIIQPVKYHAGMYVKDLFEIGAKELGFTYNSTIFKTEPFNKMVIIPEKYQQFENEGILGFTKPNIIQKGYYQGTYGDFLRAFKLMFAGKIIPRESVFNFERFDYNKSNAKYKLPDIRNDYFSLNTDEFYANTIIEFLIDTNDKNTIQEYKGTSIIITTIPKKIENIDFVLTKRLQRITIPFALAKRKESLTIPEKIIKIFADAVSSLLNAIINIVNQIIDIANTIITFFNEILDALDFIGIHIPINFATIPQIKNVDFGAQIENRVGMMHLENDFIAVPKIVLIEEDKSNKRNTKILSNNRDILNAKYLYNNFHYINNFVENNGKHNQWIKYKLDKVPFTFDDYQKVKSDNIITDKFNNFARLDSCKYYPEQGYAEISYRINKLYTNNLKNVITENTGQ